MNYCLTRLTQLQLVVTSSIAPMRYSYRSLWSWGRGHWDLDPPVSISPELKEKNMMSIVHLTRRIIGI